MFNSKVIIVTGSSAGLGAATAVNYAREGAKGVVINGRNEDALREVKKKCEVAGKGKTKVHMCVGDLAKDDVRAKIINETIREFGQLDVLVNNAAFSIPGTTSQLSIDSYDKIFAVNLRAVVALTQLAIPHLIKTKGNVVNISSLAALKAMPEITFYAMSKAALDHFSRCLAVDLGPKGVRVNSVNAGAIAGTTFTTRMGYTPEQIKEIAKAHDNSAPLGRFGTVDEYSDLILFLSSDKGSFITGTCMPIDGGARLV